MATRREALLSWRTLPEASFCHPREEHLMPLLVVAGAAGDDPGRVVFESEFMGAKMSGFAFG